MWIIKYISNRREIRRLSSFEDFLVKSWLTDLAEGAVAPGVADWVRASGLAEFENATIREEVTN